MLDVNHYGVMEVIRNGATIFDYSVATIIRQIQRFDKELVTIVDTENLKEITGEVFSAIERHPYFGVMLTDKGVRVLEEYDSQTK